MTSETRDAYCSACEAYSAARARSSAHISLITHVADALKNPEAFIEVTIEGKKSSMNTKWPLDQWPTADELRESLLAMRTAYRNMKQKWDAHSHGKPSPGSSPPPSRLGAP